MTQPHSNETFFSHEGKYLLVRENGFPVELASGIGDRGQGKRVQSVGHTILLGYHSVTSLHPKGKY